MGKILDFGGSAARKRIAEEKAEAGEYLQALGHLYSALETSPDDIETIEDLADLYADIGLLELSNKYWFKYLDIAPQGKKSVAYEELAINYFYMDNVWAAGYYFHQKVAKDGFIAEEGLDEDIIEFFSESGKRAGYRLVYPYERADYSDVIKAAKRSLSCGDYRTAICLYESVPDIKKTEEIYGDYAVALFLSDRDEEVVEACKKSVSLFGPNVTAYCNMSTLFKSKGEDEKSAVYYSLAKSVYKGADGENYKLATCAIEQGDDQTVKELLTEILKERAYDDTMNFFCAISYLNTGDYKKGAELLSVARRLNPKNLTYKYYSEYAGCLLRTGDDHKNLLPLKYAKFLPEKEEKRIFRLVKRLIAEKTPEKNLGANTREDLLYGLYCGSSDLAQDCVFILSVYGGKKGQDALYDYVLDTETDEEIKKVAVYNLINVGTRKKFGVTASSFYVKVKLAKILSKEQKGFEFYTCGYSIALARAVFSGIDDFNKLNFSANKLFVLYGAEMKEDGLLPEEVAAIITLTVKPERVSVSDVCKSYRVKPERVSGYYRRFTEHRGGIND